MTFNEWWEKEQQLILNWGGISVDDLRRAWKLGAQEELAECKANETRLKKAWDSAYEQAMQNGQALSECQAREKVLRDFVAVCIELDDFLPETVLNHLNSVIDLPFDSTALNEVIKQGQYEVLLDAAKFYDMANKPVADRLRRMAKEL